MQLNNKRKEKGILFTLHVLVLLQTVFRHDVFIKEDRFGTRSMKAPCRPPPFIIYDLPFYNDLSLLSHVVRC